MKGLKIKLAMTYESEATGRDLCADDGPKTSGTDWRGWWTKCQMQKQDPDAVSIRLDRQNKSVSGWNIYALLHMSQMQAIRLTGWDTYVASL